MESNELVGSHSLQAWRAMSLLDPIRNDLCRSMLTQSIGSVG
jgi:hypothetical protein